MGGGQTEPGPLMRYRLQIKPSAVKALGKLPAQDRSRVAKAIDALATEPRPSGVRKLSGAETLWRIRVGDYRVVYEIRDQELIVLVVRLGHRRDVYRR